MLRIGLQMVLQVALLTQLYLEHLREEAQSELGMLLLGLGLRIVLRLLLLRGPMQERLPGQSVKQLLDQYQKLFLKIRVPFIQMWMTL